MLCDFPNFYLTSNSAVNWISCHITHHELPPNSVKMFFRWIVKFLCFFFVFVVDGGEFSFSRVFFLCREKKEKKPKFSCFPCQLTKQEASQHATSTTSTQHRHSSLKSTTTTILERKLTKFLSNKNLPQRTQMRIWKSSTPTPMTSGYDITKNLS